VPFLASNLMGAMPIAAFGTAEQRDRWVRPAAAGDLILTAALSEPLNRDPLRPTTTAHRTAGGWRLDGVKTCVPAATIAAAILVPATLDEGRVDIFVVDPAGAGVTVTPQRTSNRDLEGYVELDGVHVGGDARIGSAEADGQVVEWTLERATLGLCAMQLGVTERALAETATYAINRVQFERPIATFQAVGHRCADAYIDVEAIGLTLWQAAWRLSAGLPAGPQVAVAKYWAATGGHRVAHAAVHVHGGKGVATEYFIHRYFLAAKQIEFTLGGAKEQLLRLGAHLAVEPV
jgi:acyl-CoA dehydrogenase